MSKQNNKVKTISSADASVEAIYDTDAMAKLATEHESGTWITKHALKTITGGETASFFDKDLRLLEIKLTDDIYDATPITIGPGTIDPLREYEVELIRELYMNPERMIEELKDLPHIKEIVYEIVLAVGRDGQRFYPPQGIGSTHIVSRARIQEIVHNVISLNVQFGHTTEGVKDFQKAFSAIITLSVLRGFMQLDLFGVNDATTAVYKYKKSMHPKVNSISDMYRYMLAHKMHQSFSALTLFTKQQGVDISGGREKRPILSQIVETICGEVNKTITTLHQDLIIEQDLNMLFVGLRAWLFRDYFTKEEGLRDSMDGILAAEAELKCFSKMAKNVTFVKWALEKTEDEMKSGIELVFANFANRRFRIQSIFRHLCATLIDPMSRVKEGTLEEITSSISVSSVMHGDRGSILHVIKKFKDLNGTKSYDIHESKVMKHIGSSINSTPSASDREVSRIAVYPKDAMYSKYKIFDEMIEHTTGAYYSLHENLQHSMPTAAFDSDVSQYTGVKTKELFLLGILMSDYIVIDALYHNPSLVTSHFYTNNGEVSFSDFIFIKRGHSNKRLTADHIMYEHDKTGSTLLTRDPFRIILGNNKQATTRLEIGTSFIGHTRFYIDKESKKKFDTLSTVKIPFNYAFEYKTHVPGSTVSDHYSMQFPMGHILDTGSSTTDTTILFSKIRDFSECISSSLSVHSIIVEQILATALSNFDISVFDRYTSIDRSIISSFQKNLNSVNFIFPNVKVSVKSLDSMLFKYVHAKEMGILDMGTAEERKISIDLQNSVTLRVSMDKSGKAIKCAVTLDNSQNSNNINLLQEVPAIDEVTYQKHVSDSIGAYQHSINSNSRAMVSYMLISSLADQNKIMGSIVKFAGKQTASSSEGFSSRIRLARLLNNGKPVDIELFIHHMTRMFVNLFEHVQINKSKFWDTMNNIEECSSVMLSAADSSLHRLLTLTRYELALRHFSQQFNSSDNPLAPYDISRPEENPIQIGINVATEPHKQEVLDTSVEERDEKLAIVVDNMMNNRSQTPLSDKESGKVSNTGANNDNLGPNGRP